MQSARLVTVAKGKKIQKFAATGAEKEALLQQAMGPSGNLRAPTYRVKDQIIIGFNAELYDEWLK